jgi:putative FmdB family regulatory protein
VPTYQYTCTECGEPLETVQKFSDEPLTVCPACGGRLRKVFSPVGIVFKGSGFYRTDSRKSAAAAAPATSTSTSTSDSGSSNGSADKSADTKAEPAKKTEPAKSSSASEKVA